MDPFTISLLIMAGMNAIDMFSGFFDDNAKANAYSEEKRRTEEERDAKLELMDLEYNEAKKQALKSADRNDYMSDNNERTVNFETGAAFDRLGLQQVADAYSFNNAAIQNSSQTGNELSQMAASGTRTSSMNTAVDLQSAQNEAQLQLAEDQTRAGEEQTLFSILNAYGQNAFQIQNNRTDANELRHSYDEGGYNNTYYKKQRSLQENAYNNQIADIDKAIKDNTGIRSALRNTGKLFGMQNAGAANTLANYVKDFGMPDLKTDTNYTFNKVKTDNNPGTKIPLPNGTTVKPTPKIRKSIFDLEYVPNPLNTLPTMWEQFNSFDW